MRRSTIRELLKLTARPDMISFAGGLPAPELFPLEQMRRATECVLTQRGHAALQYGETEGVAELRDWLAARFSTKGIAVERANVLITTGAQQALDLIGRIFLDEGDAVIVENPTYLALLSAWRPWGVRFLPVISDASGMCVNELDPLFAQRPKLVYSVPNFQNPQGTTLGLEGRLRLLKLLRENDAVVVEDDPYGELRYEGEFLPHLFELDRGEGRVLHVGTFSKTIAPGLRVGWVIAPEEVIEKLVLAKQGADLHTSTFCQHVLYEMVREGLLEKRLPLLREAYQERRDAMLSALEEWFPGDASWTRPEGGMFLMVNFPANVDTAELLKVALQLKVAFVPGEEFHAAEGGRNTLRLNFSNSPPAVIEQGIQRLKTAVDELS